MQMQRLALWPESKSHLFILLLILYVIKGRTSNQTFKRTFKRGENIETSWRLFFWSSCLPLQVLLELPRPLQAGGGAAVPGPGVVLSESSAGSPEERRQPDVAARLGPLLLVLPGEPQVSLLSDRSVYWSTGKHEEGFLPKSHSEYSICCVLMSPFSMDYWNNRTDTRQRLKSTSLWNASRAACRVASVCSDVKVVKVQ